MSTDFEFSLLHAATAAFHVAKDHRRTKKNGRVVHKEGQYDGRDGYADGNAPGYTGARGAQV